MSSRGRKAIGRTNVGLGQKKRVELSAINEMKANYEEPKKHAWDLDLKLQADLPDQSNIINRHAGLTQSFVLVPANHLLSPRRHTHGHIKLGEDLTEHPSPKSTHAEVMERTSRCFLSEYPLTRPASHPS